MNNKMIKSQTYDHILKTLTGVFLKGDTLGNREWASREKDLLRHQFVVNDLGGEEEWQALVLEAKEMYTEHKKEDTPTSLLNSALLPIRDDEQLLREAKWEAELWHQTIDSVSRRRMPLPISQEELDKLTFQQWKWMGAFTTEVESQLDKDSQQYVELIEELAYMETYIEEDDYDHSPQAVETLVWYMDKLEEFVRGLEMKIKINYNKEGSGEGGEAYVEYLRENTKAKVKRALAEDSMDYLHDGINELTSVDVTDHFVMEEAEARLDSDELLSLVRAAKASNYEPSFQENWAHIYYMKEKSERHMDEILAHRKAEHWIAVHATHSVEGEMKTFIFPETEELLGKYRAKLKVLAEELTEEQYHEKLVEMRMHMLRLYRSSQKKGKENYRRTFIQKMKDELAELRTLFFMPYDLEGLKKAQIKHVQQNKPVKFFPVLCRRHLQVDVMVRMTKRGKLVGNVQGLDLRAFLNKDRLITLYNDAVARLLAMGVSENALPNMRGSVFLKTYEEHMRAHGKEEEANKAVQARDERDEQLKEDKFLRDINRGVGMSYYTDSETGESYMIEVVDTNALSPEDYVLLQDSEF